MNYKKKESKEVFTFNWVLVNRLAMGSAPKSEGNIKMLKSQNINSILSLCSEEEVGSSLNLGKLFITKRYILPDHKSGRMPKLEELEKALSYLEDLLKNGPVYVHCVAAMERSPLICMSWLVKKHNISPTEALDYMMQIHKGTSPLPGQLSLLNRISL